MARNKHSTTLADNKAKCLFSEEGEAMSPLWLGLANSWFTDTVSNRLHLPGCTLTRHFKFMGDSINTVFSGAFDTHAFIEQDRCRCISWSVFGSDDL